MKFIFIYAICIRCHFVHLFTIRLRKANLFTNLITQKKLDITEQRVAVQTSKTDVSTLKSITQNPVGSTKAKHEHRSL